MTDDPRTVGAETIEACLEYEREHWRDNQGSTAYWTGLLLAASREIDCPARSFSGDIIAGEHIWGHPDDCDVCGGSGRLRVLL